MFSNILITQTSSETQFDSIELESNIFYEVSFAHLIIQDNCSSLVFKAYLQDMTSLNKKKIFDSTVDIATLETNKWTFLRRCIQVFQEDYYRIVIEPKSRCNDGSFIAFDELRVRKIDDSEDTIECLDRRVTMEPTIEISTDKDDFTTQNSESYSSFDPTLSINCKNAFIVLSI